MTRRAFTLLEVLVVVAILAALLATLTGLAAKARREAKVLEFHAERRRVFDANVERRRLEPRLQDEYLRLIDRQVKWYRERVK